MVMIIRIALVRRAQLIGSGERILLNESYLVNAGRDFTHFNTEADLPWAKHRSTWKLEEKTHGSPCW